MQKMRFAALLICPVFLASCAAPRINATKLASARYYEAAKLKQIAVLPFDGSHGADFSSEIEGTLATISVADRQFFSLVDRNKLDSVIAEMKLGKSSLVNEATAARIGNIAGAKGIYTGVITASDTNDSYYKEERTRCAYNVTKKDKKGRDYETCGKYEKYHVRCTKRVAKFAFVPKLIEVETAKIVYSNNIEGDSSAAVCSDSQKPLPAGSELLQKAKETAKQKFRKDIAPYYVNVVLNLMDSTSGIKADQAKEKFKQGLAYADGGRMDRACELWDEARTQASDAPAVLYNLGICAELAGNPQTALELYKRSDSCLGEPDMNITSALTRISSDIRNSEKLKEQTE